MKPHSGRSDKKMDRNMPRETGVIIPGAGMSLLIWAASPAKAAIHSCFFGYCRALLLSPF